MCRRAGYAKSTQINPRENKGCGGAAGFVEIRSVTKIQILFFYTSIARYDLEEENRRLEKPHYQIDLVHSSNATISMTREEIEQRMDELARKYAETQRPGHQRRDSTN
jgi:hypothetical protein